MVHTSRILSMANTWNPINFITYLNPLANRLSTSDLDRLTRPAPMDLSQQTLKEESMARTPEYNALLAKYVPITDEVARNSLNEQVNDVNAQLQNFQSARDTQINQLNEEFNRNIAPLQAKREEIMSLLEALNTPAENPETTENLANPEVTEEPTA